MNLIDLEEQYQYREENSKMMNKNKVQEIQKYFFSFCKHYNMDYQRGNGLWDTFIRNYRFLINKGFQNEVYPYMKANGFKEDAFIYELLHYRETDQDLKKLITKKENSYSITFDHKEIEFMNASEYFINTDLEKFFQTKKLEGECFDRTLDLVSCIEGSKAIVSYLPHLFVGGYYHAYVICSNGMMIDPASNLILINDSAKRLLNGQIVYALTKDEIDEAMFSMQEIDYIEEYDRPKLLKLALFVECQTIQQEELNTRISRK